MKPGPAIVLLWIVYVACGTLASAVCAGQSVRAFGANCDDSSGDTAAIKMRLMLLPRRESAR